MKDRFIREIHIDWEGIPQGSYLSCIEALRDTELVELKSDVTFFVGENGTGKSTLLEAVAEAVGFNREGGTFNYRFSTFREEAGLPVWLTRGGRRPRVGYFFRAESFYNVATRAEEYGAFYGGRTLHAQSHGEGFLSFFQSFTGPGLYLMDEPEAALSPGRQLALFIHIAELAEAGSQFIIATHSPILLALPGADIISFDGPLHRCAYQDTESYRLSELFINDRERMIRRLLEE